MSEELSPAGVAHPCQAFLALLSTSTSAQAVKHTRDCPTCRAIDTTLTVDPDGLSGTLTFLVEKEQT